MRSRSAVSRSIRLSINKNNNTTEYRLDIYHSNHYTMKVTIKQWNAVATWRWDMPDDEVCGICRVQFDGTCPTCKFPGDDCSLCKCFPRFGNYTNSSSTRKMWPFLPYGWCCLDGYMNSLHPANPASIAS